MRIHDHLQSICTKKIAAFLENTNRKNFGKVSYKDGLKFAILNEASIEVEVISNSSFAIYEGSSALPEINGAILTDSRICEFIMGARRVSSQYSNIEKAKESSISSSWLLVTAYYCSFFAINEISRMYDKIPLGLDLNDQRQLKTRLKGDPTKISQFIETNPSNFIGKPKAGKIVFESVGEKPHAAAWSNAKKIMKSINDEKGWHELANYIKLFEGSQWQSPSQTRNEWNYKYADYFSSRGELEAKTFKKLIGNLNGAGSWFNSAKPTDAASNAASIAVICELFSNAVIASYKALFDTKILERE